MRISRQFLASTVALLAALLTGQAHGSLVATATGFDDTATGLSWLKTSDTVGQSYAQVLASTYVVTQGYQFATTAQLNTLFSNAGGANSPNPDPVPENLIPADNLLKLFGGCESYLVGLSCANTSQYFTIGMTAGGDNLAIIDVFQDLGWGLLKSTFVPTFSRVDFASFLVAPTSSTTVPEPASLALVGAALLGLGAARRKRSQH